MSAYSQYFAIPSLTQAIIFWILDRGPLRNCDDGDFGHDAHRILVKLSEASNILPAALSVNGVTLLEKHAKFGGGFSDIFRASYQGKEVALKRMRVFQRGEELQAINRVAYFCGPHLIVLLMFPIVS